MTERAALVWTILALGMVSTTPAMAQTYYPNYPVCLQGGAHALSTPNWPFVGWMVDDTPVRARRPPNNSTAQSWGNIIYPCCSAVSLRQLRNVSVQPTITTRLIASNAGSRYWE